MKLEKMNSGLHVAKQAVEVAGFSTEFCRAGSRRLGVFGREIVFFNGRFNNSVVEQFIFHLGGMEVMSSIKLFQLWTELTSNDGFTPFFHNGGQLRQGFIVKFNIISLKS